MEQSVALATVLCSVLGRVAAIEARLAALESLAEVGAEVSTGRSDLEAALAKLGASIKLAQRG